MYNYTPKTEILYSKIRYDIPSNISHDGSLIFITDNIIWEIKYESDVVGKIQ